MKFVAIALLLAAALCAAPTNRDNTIIVPSLKGLVFISDPKDLQKSGLATSGVSVSPVPPLNQPAIQKTFQTYLGRPVTLKTLNEITGKVAAFYKQQNHPLVDVVAPEQDVTSGVVQIVVNEFRVGEVRVKGNRWFSDNVVSAHQFPSRRHGRHPETSE
jgi:hypothetical protein